MELGHIEYDAQGVMLEPRPSVLKQTPVYPGGVVSSAPGQYHVYKIEAATYDRLVELAARLNQVLNTVNGLVILRIDEYAIPMPHRYGMEIIYAVRQTQQAKLNA